LTATLIHASPSGPGSDDEFEPELDDNRPEQTVLDEEGLRIEVSHVIDATIEQVFARCTESPIMPEDDEMGAEGEEEERAARRIQAMQRGKCARKELAEQSDAATKIAAAHRGRQDRARLAQMDLDKPLSQPSQPLVPQMARTPTPSHD